jgi:hypothetical protein
MAEPFTRITYDLKRAREALVERQITLLAQEAAVQEEELRARTAILENVKGDLKLLGPNEKAQQLAIEHLLLGDEALHTTRAAARRAKIDLLRAEVALATLLDQRRAAEWIVRTAMLDAAINSDLEHELAEIAHGALGQG